MTSVADVLDDLRLATDILRAVKTRDAGAWPLAEQLAELEVLRAVTRLAKAQRAPEAWTPILATEAELSEVFGEPGRLEMSSKRLPRRKVPARTLVALARSRR